MFNISASVSINCLLTDNFEYQINLITIVLVSMFSVFKQMNFLYHQFTCSHFVLQAKRDPYRFRFPIELRFVDPNVDHLMYDYVFLVFNVL